MTSFRYLYLCE